MTQPETQPHTKLLKLKYDTKLDLWTLGASKTFLSIVDVCDHLARQYNLQDYREVFCQLVLGVSGLGENSQLPSDLLELYKNLEFWKGKIYELQTDS